MHSCFSSYYIFINISIEFDYTTPAWRDIDFVKSQIYIKSSLGRVYDVNNTSETKTLLRVSTPKTQKGTRRIDLIEELVVDFKRHKEKQTLLLGYEPEIVFANILANILSQEIFLVFFIL